MRALPAQLGWELAVVQVCIPGGPPKHGTHTPGSGVLAVGSKMESGPEGHVPGGCRWGRARAGVPAWLPLA